MEKMPIYGFALLFLLNQMVGIGFSTISVGALPQEWVLRHLHGLRRPEYIVSGALFAHGDTAERLELIEVALEVRGELMEEMVFNEEVSK